MPVRHALERLRREESGFTLVELLVSCVIGTVILMASFTMLDSSVVLTGKVTDRVDRTQRSRVAMDRIARELRSQVCPAAGIPAMIDGQNYSVTFYSFMGTGTFVPDRRQILWDTNTNSIIEKKWNGAGASPYTTWPVSPSSTSTLLTDVKPPPSNAPMFTYMPVSLTPFSTPLSAANAQDTSVIRIQFRTFAQSRNATGASTTLQNQVFVRTADPNGTQGSTSPECA
jgi:prepilin-type N-terminal cleavage/methylation domain-containing protein